MLCDYKVIKRESYITNEWSGGVTTQFCIYPDNAKYKNRDFIWRLSSATVETESSEFTKLPDYNRILMVLDGRMELNHNDVEIINLNTFDQNEFDGASNTISLGKAVDFNLMMRKDKCSGKLKAFSIDSHEGIKVNEILGFYNDDFTLAIYAFKSNIEIRMDADTKILLNQGNTLLINFNEHVSNFEIELENLCDDEAKVIMAQMFYTK